jgi:hypothetical protein
MTMADLRGSSPRLGRGLIVLLGVALLAGCSGTTASGGPSAVAITIGTAAPTIAPTVTATPTAAEASPSEAAGLPSETAAPTAIDPCVLVTSAEASTLAGATFGAGTEHTTKANLRSCVYGAQTLNVFTVEVIQAPDLATAKAAEAAVEADIKAAATKGLTVTQVSGLGDNAVVGEGSATIGGVTAGVSSIGVLKGTIFFGFSDLVLGHAAPTSAALQAQARTCLTRLG